MTTTSVSKPKPKKKKIMCRRIQHPWTPAYRHKKGEPPWDVRTFRFNEDGSMSQVDARYTPDDDADHGFVADIIDQRVPPYMLLTFEEAKRVFTLAEENAKPLRWAFLQIRNKSEIPPRVLAKIEKSKPTFSAGRTGETTAIEIEVDA